MDRWSIEAAKLHAEINIIAIHMSLIRTCVSDFYSDVCDMTSDVSTYYLTIHQLYNIIIIFITVKCICKRSTVHFTTTEVK